MKTNSNSRQTQFNISDLSLPEWLSGRLSSYAAAAGLGAFGFAQAADGAIVFTDVPDATITQSTPSQTLYINLDSVGYNEFAVAAHSNGVRVNPYNVGPQSSKVLTSGNYYVNSIIAGAEIGPTSAEAVAPRFAGRQAGPYFYNFVGADKYLGLKWDIGSGNFLYGWARLDVTADNMGTATLFGFAYETEPNTSIVAGQIPEPSSLALLAAGGGAVALKRRRRSS